MSCDLWICILLHRTALLEPRRSPPASSFWHPGRLPDGLRGVLDHPPSQSWWSGWSQGWLNPSQGHKTSLNGFGQLQNRRFQALRCPPAFVRLYSLQIAPTWFRDLSRVGAYYRTSTFTKKVHSNLQSGALGSDSSETRKCGNTRELARKCR